jgi:lipopolysaccharide biosynthesis glycosyltransferase
MNHNAALVLAADSGYFPFACIAAKQAIARASRPLPVVLIHDGVPEETLAAARRYLPELVIADAAPLLEGRNFNTGMWPSRAAYIRLFIDQIPAIDPYDRVLYTDCDVSFVTDPWKLLSANLAQAPIMAAYDWRHLPDISFRSRLSLPPGTPYFNSGVTLLDLAAIRTQGQLEAARDFATNHRQLCIDHDQDALNVAFQGKWQVLDWRWNAVSLYGDLMKKRPFIRHFTGKKPWFPDKRGVEPEFIETWHAAIAASPWAQLYEALQSPRNRLKYKVYPYSQALERVGKRMLFSRTDTVRGMRARLLGRFAQVLENIEQAASAGRLAAQYPERTLLE